jgi:hypothetical protein
VIWFIFPVDKKYNISEKEVAEEEEEKKEEEKEKEERNFNFQRKHSIGEQGVPARSDTVGTIMRSLVPI